MACEIIRVGNSDFFPCVFQYIRIWILYRYRDDIVISYPNVFEWTASEWPTLLRLAISSSSSSSSSFYLWYVFYHPCNQSNRPAFLLSNTRIPFGGDLWDGLPQIIVGKYYLSARFFLRLRFFKLLSIYSGTKIRCGSFSTF